MYGYVYLTTNLVNNRKYIGQHKGQFNEWYKGSGKLIKQAFDKYGYENFKVELIEICDSYEELNEREYYWIKYYNAAESKEFYNLTDGGLSGNWTSNGISIKKGKCISDDARCNTSISHLGVYSSWNDERRKQKSESNKGSLNYFYGKQFSDEMLEHLSKVRRDRKWINNGVQETNILEYQLEMYLKKGWKRGRIKRNQVLEYYTDENKVGRYLISKGDVEVLLSSEELESQRYKYLNTGFKAGKSLSKLEKYLASKT